MNRDPYNPESLKTVVLLIASILFLNSGLFLVWLSSIWGALLFGLGALFGAVAVAFFWNDLYG